MVSDFLNILIPARGGSKRVVGKNLRLVGDDTLIGTAIRTAQDFQRTLPENMSRIVVSTDDRVMMAVARLRGVETWGRDPHHADDEFSIDDLVAYYGRLHPGDWMVIQPTVPEVKVTDLQNLVLSDTSITLGKATDHLYWTANDDRVPAIQELGVRYYPAGTTGYRVDKVWWKGVGDYIDIDTYEDLETVRARQRKLAIHFHVKVNSIVGSGHWSRAQSLMRELGHHELSVSFTPDSETSEYPYDPLGPPDVVVVDALGDMRGVESYNAPIVSLEDQVNHLVDLRINALYPSGDLLHEVNGADYAIIRPEFAGLEWSPPDTPRVLVSFGGFDPGGLTAKTRGALTGLPWETVFIQPPLAEPKADPVVMAEEMMNATLVVTSAGRTLYEAAALGIPAVAMAQNPRETTHIHLGPSYGNVYVGLGATTSDSKLRDAVETIVDNPELQTMLSERGRYTVDGKGLQRVVKLIEETGEKG